MNLEMYQKHQEVYDFLINTRKDQKDLTFTFRKNDFKGRLSKGYWFYGNEDYLAISFWAGMDWKNRTPNIIFRIKSDGSTLLECTTKDSARKYDFIKSNIVPQISGLEPSNKKFIKLYSSVQGDYMEALKSFLSNDKKIIDTVISGSLEVSKSDLGGVSNQLGFISQDEFTTRWNYVKKFKRNIDISQILSPSVKLRSFKIENFSPIKSLEVNDISGTAHWIFFTGLNGTGKTSILKALAAGLCNNTDNAQQVITETGFSINLVIDRNRKLERHYIDSLKHKEPVILSSGLAAYGALRQNVREVNDDKSNVSGITYGIFNNDGLLLDLNQQLTEWRRNGSTQNMFPEAEDRISQISELLPEIIESLVSIELPEKTVEGIWEKTKYVEEDENEEPLDSVEFDQLASGIKSMVAMFGDMLLRLYAQQPGVSDPTQLEGIVIIDEIDVHLHPIFQKKLVEVLTSIFANIQFIVSTHSPIPLLGAPKNSVIYNVRRNRSQGVIVESLSNLEIDNLLPNALLTSPIFGMQQITPVSNQDVKDLIVDDNYDDVEFFKEVEKKIDDLIKKVKD